MLRKVEKLLALRRLMGQEEISKSDEVVFFCPLCPVRHRKPKLSANLFTDNWHCWICGRGGKNFLNLIPHDDPIYSDYKRSIEEMTPVEPVRVFDTPKLPSEFISLTAFSHSPNRANALAYLKARGIGPNEIALYKLGYCETGTYAGRIIFPSYDLDGNLNFFVGRDFTGHAWVKYLHGEFDKNIIFNEYLVDWDKPVVLTEGPFDAVKAGTNAIPLQSSHTLHPFSLVFKRIVYSGVPVSLALDEDAVSHQIKLAEFFLKYGVECRYVDVKGSGLKDLGEMTFGACRELLERAVPITDKTDLFRFKVGNV